MIDWSAFVAFIAVLLTIYLGLRKDKNESKNINHLSESSEANTAEIYQRIAAAVGMEKIRLLADFASEKELLTKEISSLRRDITDLKDEINKLLEIIVKLRVENKTKIENSQ